MPLRVIPDLIKAPENRVQSARSKEGDVFNDDPRRPGFRDDAEHVEPEAGVLPFEASPSAGDADVGTGKPATHDIRERNTACLKGSASELSNVTEQRNVGPMLSENPSGEVVVLTEGDGAESTCSFKPETETADAAEKIDNIEHLSFLL